MKTSRRDLAFALLAPAAAASASPQNQPAPLPVKEDLLGAARGQVRANSKQLADFKLPIATEPSFQFKA